MTLVLGTNCGLVTTAPTSDPSPGSSYTISENIFAQKITTPSSDGNISITGMGWWYDLYATAQPCYSQVGIYKDNEGLPGDLVNAQDCRGYSNIGSSSRWVKVTSYSSVELSPETDYWIAVQCDDTPSYKNNIGRETTGGNGAYNLGGQTECADPFPSPTATTTLWGIYAVWEAAATGTNTQINIGDAWKAISAAKVNIGDDWKAVAGIQVNIGDAWKEVF